MLRFFAIFTIVLMLGLIMLAAVLSQYGYSLLDPEMQVMIAVCVQWPPMSAGASTAF